MAPTRKSPPAPAGAATPKRAKASVPQRSSQTSALDWSQTDNAPFWLALQKNIDAALATDVYTRLRTDTPLGIGSGWCAHAFKEADAIAALGAEPYKHSCSANIFSVRMNCAPNPAPIAKASKKITRERLFKDGGAPLSITVGILSGDVPNAQTVVERGDLALLSPE